MLFEDIEGSGGGPVPEPQNSAYWVEMCPDEAMLAPGAMLHLCLPGLDLIFFTEKMGYSCPMYLVCLKQIQNALP